jgi:hypothetical protein
MNKKYQIESYDRKPTSFLGHICYTEPAESLEEAKLIAKKYQELGKIQIRILKGKECILRYAEQG